MSARPARVGLLSLGVGLAAAGVGAAIGLAAERAALSRVVPRSPQDGEEFGSLRGIVHVVHADDGTALHVEVDEAVHHQVDGMPADEHADDVPLTVVFSHGYALTQDAWHFQRLALRGRFRLVFWDQRGHGRSGTGPKGSATIDQVGRDLGVVVDEIAPEGPLLLVGHSMGGMTVMSLAQERPQLFADRVFGVALISTSAGGLGQVDFGVPGFSRIARWVAPTAAQIMARTPRIVERGRKIGSDLETVFVRRYSFASPVPEPLVLFAAEMIASTRLDVISEYLPTFAEHDKREALETLQGIEVLIMVGDGDLMTPASHSEEIVHRLPGAEHVVVHNGGHLLMLEHPDEVNAHLLELIERAMRAARAAQEAARQRHGHGVAASAERLARAARRAVRPARRRRRDGAA